MILHGLRRILAQDPPAATPAPPEQHNDHAADTALLAARDRRIHQLEFEARRAHAAQTAYAQTAADLGEQVQALTHRLNHGTDAEHARALATLQVYEDRLAAYEGRWSPITCPRACCAPKPPGTADASASYAELAHIKRLEDA